MEEKEIIYLDKLKALGAKNSQHAQEVRKVAEQVQKDLAEGKDLSNFDAAGTQVGFPSGPIVLFQKEKKTCKIIHYAENARPPMVNNTTLALCCDVDEKNISPVYVATRHIPVIYQLRRNFTPEEWDKVFIIFNYHSVEQLAQWAGGRVEGDKCIID